MSSTPQRWVVLKFGGTSVATAERWRTVAAVINERLAEGLRPIVVCSAMSGVSNALEECIRKAQSGESSPFTEQLVRKHEKLASDLGVEIDSECRRSFAELDKVLLGVSLLGEASPKHRARIMATGELLSTRLGHAFLARSGIGSRWVDARECLRAEPMDGAKGWSHYLSSDCVSGRNDELAGRFAGFEEPCVITQGFIAADDAGETVLMGRGGSDTSAAYFAAAVSAERCEIWTDVPGMFTTNPHSVPSARLLAALDYDEAQEIASTGAKVLHPRCVAPLKTAAIPLHIRCTPRPDLPGTVVSNRELGGTPQVKAISARLGIKLISLSTVGMWRRSGFLADVFQVFKQHGISIDLMSTSESNVTVSLDSGDGKTRSDAIDALLVDLSKHCDAQVIGPCSAVSLVGNRIRALMHRLGPALEVFEEQKIHLVSQAASDLNLTFVVNEDQAERLVTQLHKELVQQDASSDSMGPSWEELYHEESSAQSTPRWWHERTQELIYIAANSTPAYVYNTASVDDACAKLTGMKSIDRVFYATKANSHPELLRRIYKAGLSFECVSPGEIEHVMSAVPEVTPDNILFTPNFAPREEYENALAMGVHVTLDNLHPLKHWGETFRGKEVAVRLDPGQGRGHHKFVKTAGSRSKFGIAGVEIDTLRELVAKYDVKIVGLHAHTGSGIRTSHNWSEIAMFFVEVAKLFPDVRFLDLGGGLGVPEKSGQSPLDISDVDSSLASIKAAHPEYELWMEPGRFVVATSGVLLARVTQLKEKGEVRYVGVDAGMHTLIRPALYGSWHDIVNISARPQDDIVVANVVGPICESGDTLGYERRLPAPQEGDILLVDVVGAYGKVMSSDYNMRRAASEVFV